MRAPDEQSAGAPLRTAHPFDITGAKERLAAGDGGYEVVHLSAGLEIGVYVLVAPEPDKQQPHDDDEVYVVLEGRGTLEVGEKRVELREGHAVFVPAGAEHRFVGYEQLRFTGPLLARDSALRPGTACRVDRVARGRS